ncbi:CDP-alcohol phosphatidyltransferase family protein [Afifella sp. YEN Y35]|uniref:CDP-alcohol phosphatidyltransferase family protein n=1 Tax=Afifella sp. YEN Y35 TaxID=3388337 RepID=UPI0039E0B501
MSLTTKSAYKTALVNALTFSRLLVGVASIFLFQDSAGLLLALAFLYMFISDLADGHLARRWEAATRGGAIFDYVVDRFNIYLQIALLVSIGVPVLYFMPFFLRDTLYIFVQTYIATLRIDGTKSMSFVGTACIYLYVLFSSLLDIQITYLNNILFAALMLSLANMTLRTYRLRAQLIEEVRRDFHI